jgi:hypothetical protein
LDTCTASGDADSLMLSPKSANWPKSGDDNPLAFIQNDGGGLAWFKIVIVKIISLCQSQYCGL